MAYHFQYLGGLSEGQPKHYVEFSVEKGRVKVKRERNAFGGWEQYIPLTSINGLSVDLADKHVTAGRLLLVGVFAFAFKKSDYVLAISFGDDGFGSPCQALFHGKQQDLEKARQEIIKARGKLPSLPPAEPATPAAETSPAGLIAQLAGLRDKGIITPEEFEAKKADIMARL